MFLSQPPTTTTPALPAGWTRTLFAEFFDKPLDPKVWTTRNDGGQDNNSASNLASNVTVAGGVLSIKGGRNPAGSAKPFNAGYIDTKGYGRAHHPHRYGFPSIGAHRLVYELLVGPIPAGLVVDHQNLCHASMLRTRKVDRWFSQTLHKK